jgi:carbon storage regulator
MILHPELPEGIAMLVLTRRPEEEIVIDGGIRITVLGIVGNKVRLGIVAPASVRVDRSEIVERRATGVEEGELAVAGGI